MQQIKIRRAIALLAVTTSIIVAAVGTSAAAQTNRVQQQIDAHLAAYPGGKQVGPTEISYNSDTFIITFTRHDWSSLAADCPSGWFCFYDQRNYGYPRGKLSSCGWQDLALYGWLDRIESAYYNMSRGRTDFINHGAYPNHSTDDVIFAISTSNRGVTDVAPFRNAADHVNRVC